jgi:hypothetical protein
VSVISLLIFKNIIFETPGRFKINLKIIKNRVFTICFIQQYIVKFAQELETSRRSKSTTFHAFLISFLLFNQRPRMVCNSCAGSSGAVHSVFLIDVYLDLENPGGSGFSGGGEQKGYWGKQRGSIYEHQGAEVDGS